SACIVESPHTMSITSLHVETARLDPRRFRNVIGSFATGVAVITTELDRRYHRMTVNSLTSGSLDPPLLLVCSRHGSPTGEAISRRGEFAVNILAAHQRQLSDRFVSVAVAERFTGIGVELSPRGMPLLTGAIAHICCRVHVIHPGGDHEIILGEVLTCSDAE